MTVSATIPVIRIFDYDRAKAFYLDWLSFSLDWEHRFEPNTPVYAQVSLGPLRLHLSEHHGDCCPGAKVFIECTDLASYHAELLAKKYAYMRSGLEKAFWNALTMEVIDPFHNQLLFSQPINSQHCYWIDDCSHVHRRYAY